MSERGSEAAPRLMRPRRHCQCLDGMPLVFSLVFRKIDMPTPSYKSHGTERSTRWQWIAATAVAAIVLPMSVAKAQDGRLSFQRCAACHSTTPGTKGGLGPNLNGVVGRPVAREPGYRYSTALANAKGTWTAELLDKFLANPARAFPGTRMAIGGIPSAAERRAIIAYIITQSQVRR